MHLRLREREGTYFLLQAAETAARRWRKPDQGIWEVRGPSRHLLHSELMCWVVLDRAIDLVSALGATPEQVTAWLHTRRCKLTMSSSTPA
ncbi:glycoside hydrolase family 15 protein [Streptomyces sp. NPDC094466]|uniref:glycoside hydrolase family 15 protein n=1 Tax=Streptomyces sp. NPDC094466 TaxID=3366065 RepID=UPI00382463A3